MDDVRHVRTSSRGRRRMNRTPLAHRQTRPDIG